MSDEWAEFSKRLATAMHAAGHEPRPSVLFKQFNTRFRGRSVSFQTASRWLRGDAIPRQDKLVALADWLKVDRHFLRFGDRGGTRAGGHRHISEDPAAYEEQELFSAFRALPVAQRKLVRELIAALSETSQRKKGA
ncbi:MAG: hypothetical protein ACYCZD_03105 [Rhodanobacter sp.]